jgi:hypothetical protein
MDSCRSKHKLCRNNLFSRLRRSAAGVLFPVRQRASRTGFPAILLVQIFPHGQRGRVDLDPGHRPLRQQLAGLCHCSRALVGYSPGVDPYLWPLSVRFAPSL